MRIHALLRKPRIVQTGPALALALAVVLGGCEESVTDHPGLSCTVLVAPPAAPDPVTEHDSLDVIVALPERSEPVEALVRVDPVAEEGVVVFPADAPPTAAAVGATLTIRAVYTVCVSSAPRAIVFRGDAPLHGKVWIRVSSDRPVRTVIRVGAPDAPPLGPPLVVTPGSSGRMRWSPGSRPGGTGP